MGRTNTTTRPYRLMLGAGGVSLVGAVLLAIFYAGEPAAQLRDPSPKPVAPASVPAAPAAVGDTPSVLKSGLVSKWESYTTRDGLPSDKAFAIRVDGDRVWVGTTRGLALFENGTWHRYGTEDGLPHPVILSLDVSPRTGDLWIGTMGGLARFSAGRFDVYSQLHSGLPNDFVNSVRCDPDEDTVWVATAMGAGRLNLRTDSWSIYTHANTPMHEPWTYSVTLGEGAVYIGAWGAGILEFTKETGRWREYRDPDKEFEIDLFRDDGPVSDITASVDFASGLLWQATYTGAARYDGREWRSFLDDDSGLAGNFINFVHAEGSRAWFATDQGVSFTDGEDWVTYRRREDGRGEMVGFRDGEKLAPRVTSTALAHNYVLGVDTTEDEVWLATGQGVSRGFRSKGSMNSLLHGLEVVEVAEMIGSPGDGRTE